MRRDQERIEVREQGYFEPKFAKVYWHVHDRYARRVGLRAWALYTSLKRFANFSDGKNCYVSQERLAIIWGVTTRTVQRQIRKLRDFGLIRVKITGRVSLITIQKIRFRPDKNVGSDPSQMSFQTRQKSRTDQRVFTRGYLPEGGVDKSSRDKQQRRGQKGHPSPRFTQKDFDERDYRKLMAALKTYSSNPDVTVGMSREDRNEEFLRNVRAAAADAGLLPRRAAELLKKVYPNDPLVDQIEPKKGRKKA